MESKYLTNSILPLSGLRVLYSGITQSEGNADFGSPNWGELTLGLLTEPSRQVVLSKALIMAEQRKQLSLPDGLIGNLPTIRQLIGTSALSVTIMGELFEGNKNVFPELLLKHFLDLVRASEPVTIAGNVPEVFGIGYLLISAYSVAQIEGTPNILGFTIKASAIPSPEAQLNINLQ